MNIERVAQYPRRDDEAQRAKLELVCDKLALGPGERCLTSAAAGQLRAIHAAATRGTEVVGITLSEPQARFAQHRAARAASPAGSRSA